jgi:hypothetical protein
MQTLDELTSNPEEIERLRALWAQEDAAERDPPIEANGQPDEAASTPLRTAAAVTTPGESS